MLRAARHLRRNMALKPINLILDWDGTITVKDTMFAYGKIADTRDARLNRELNGSKLFGGFGKAWIDDYSSHEEAYSPKSHERNQVAQESAWLKSLSAVETRSAQRVENTEFFTGVTHNDISVAAKDLLDSGDLSLRTGWDEVFLRAQGGASNSFQPTTISNVSILSVNWSEAFIRASLKAAANALPHSSRLDNYFDHLDIAANEIKGIFQPGGSSGQLTDSDHAVIRTSFDKLQNFKAQQGFHNVYVGDSATDFDCLQAADLGICIRDESIGSSARTLADTLSRVGYSVRHVNDVGTWQELSTSTSNVLWARDFNEILGLLERLQGHNEGVHPE
jgi:hypothetical protein